MRQAGAKVIFALSRSIEITVIDTSGLNRDCRIADCGGPPPPVVAVRRNTPQKVVEQFHSNASCLTHIHAMSSWDEYTLNEECGTSVANPLDSARSEQVRLNRHYFESVVVVRYVDENGITNE